MYNIYLKVEIKVLGFKYGYVVNLNDYVCYIDDLI